MEFLKWIIFISVVIGIFTSPFVVPLQALVYKMAKGTPYLHTLYYCGVRSMRIQRVLFYIVVPIQFIFVLAIGFQTPTNNSNIKTIFIMVIATLFSYSFLVLWEKFFKRKLRECNEKLKAEKDMVSDEEDEYEYEYENSENLTNNSNTQEKKTYIDDFLPEGSEREYRKPGISPNLKIVLYTLLFFFVIAPLLIFTIESFKNFNTFSYTKQPSLEEINADIRRAQTPPNVVQTSKLDGSNIKIELNNFVVNNGVEHIIFKVSNYGNNTINGAIFKMQLYDLFDRNVCFIGGENSTIGFDNPLEFQKTITPNTFDFVQIEIPQECHKWIEPKNKYKYTITILRLV